MFFYKNENVIIILDSCVVQNFMMKCIQRKVQTREMQYSRNYNFHSLFVGFICNSALCTHQISKKIVQPI